MCGNYKTTPLKVVRDGYIYTSLSNYLLIVQSIVQGNSFEFVLCN